MKACVLLLCAGLCIAVPAPEVLEIEVEDLPTYDEAEVAEGFYEDDIELLRRRNAVQDPSKKWPDGVVYYQIVHSDFSSATVETIMQAMLEVQSNTQHGLTNCVQFVERTNEPDYVYIHKGTGCHYKVGRQGGRQEMSVGTGCERKGTIMHELIATLGFWHEQNRNDRDDHLVIHTENVDPNYLHNFAKHTDVDALGFPYDFGSITHYGAYTFAVDKSLPSLSPKPGQALDVMLGQRREMSVTDVAKVQKLYGCPADTSHITQLSSSMFIVDCHFDTSMCDLQQDTQDDFDWARRSGGTPTPNTGPNADHTSSMGSYIYAEASGHHGQKTRLLLPTAEAGQYCIDFYLYQHGNQEGTFEVLAAGSRITEQAVKTITGEQTAQWKHFRINLNVPADFHLILQATIGAGDSSDIAVDDFSFYHGRCV